MCNVAVARQCLWCSLLARYPRILVQFLTPQSMKLHFVQTYLRWIRPPRQGNSRIHAKRSRRRLRSLLSALGGDSSKCEETGDPNGALAYQMHGNLKHGAASEELSRFPTDGLIWRPGSSTQAATSENLARSCIAIIIARHPSCHSHQP
jgi:hypothetical protein